MAGWWPDDGWVVAGGGLASAQNIKKKYLVENPYKKEKLNTVFNKF